MDYYDAILKCACRYRDMVSEATYWGGWIKYNEVFNFILKLITECKKKELSIMKLNRWLGYIQGILIERGLTTVKAERDWTRLIFTPLDKELYNG